jgi:3-methyl-2-oxobutanoate hydroxymethyltransferase
MRLTINKIHDMKKAGEKITMLTAYDYSTAHIVDEAGVNIILVGDTLGMVVLGYETTVPVTIEDMLSHTRAVVRGTKNALVIGDMPFMTYQVNPDEAVRNAGRFMQESGCQAVKLEGGVPIAGTIRRIVDAGIPVMGHIGLTPQSINQLGGYRVQGKTTGAAKRLMDDALAVQNAGAFAIVLELVPIQLAGLITKKLDIPTIGIGAGPRCDGEVQVIHDILGWFPDFVPKHTRQYARLSVVIKKAVEDYVNDVKSGAFPTAENASSIDEELLKDL